MVDPNRITHDTPELRDVLLGFLESASSLCDMMNTTMAAVPDEIMSIQADEACGAEYGRRSESRVNSRNGYRERKLETTVGTLPLMVPKLRSGSYFPTDLFERWSRTDRALAAAVAEMYVTGTSTRKVEKVAAKFGVESLSKDQVSRLCAVIDAGIDALAHLSFPREHRVKTRTDNVQERMNCELKRRVKVVQAFPSTGSVMGLLGGIIDEIDAGRQSGNAFMSKESLGPVLALERAGNRIEEIGMDEEVMANARVIMAVALDEFAKAA